MSGGFEIEHGIAMAKVRLTGPGSVLHDTLVKLYEADPGASAFFPDGSLAGKRPGQTLCAAAGRVGGPGWYATRRVDGGIRIWKLMKPHPWARPPLAPSQPSESTP